MESIKEVLVMRDGLSVKEADIRIRDAQNQVMDGANPEDVLLEEFGLEPDYVFDLIENMYEVSAK